MNNTHGAKHFVSAQATIYKDFVSVYVPNVPYLSNRTESRNILTSSASKDDYETDEERSLRRTRKAIKDYARCNDFDQFVTFTFASDRQNITHSKSKMANWLKNQRTRNGKFRYLIVSEFHKDRSALHFHALFGDYRGKIVKAINPRTSELLFDKGKQIYNLVEYKSGFTSLKLIDEKAESKTIVAFYLQKYLVKDMPLFFGKNRYWVSKGLVKPTKVEVTEKWYEDVSPQHIQNVDYGKILYFDRQQVEIFLP